MTSLNKGSIMICYKLFHTCEQVTAVPYRFYTTMLGVDYGSKG